MFYDAALYDSGKLLHDALLSQMNITFQRRSKGSVVREVTGASRIMDRLKVKRIQVPNRFSKTRPPEARAVHDHSTYLPFTDHVRGSLIQFSGPVESSPSNHVTVNLLSDNNMLPPPIIRRVASPKCSFKSRRLAHFDAALETD